MKVQIRDTIINDEYSVMAKTEDIIKVAKKVADSPSGVVIVKGKDSKILGVVTYKNIINSLLEKKDISKLKFKDIIQKNIMIVNETDSIDKTIKRVNRRKPVATVVVNEKGQLVGYFSKSDISYANACQQIVNNLLK